MLNRIQLIDKFMNRRELRDLLYRVKTHKVYEVYLIGASYLGTFNRDNDIQLYSN